MRAKRVSLQVFMGILNQAGEKAKENGNKFLAEMYKKAAEEIGRERKDDEKKQD